MGLIELEEYKDYRIQANRAPETQFEYGPGLGWALRVSDKRIDRPPSKIHETTQLQISLTARGEVDAEVLDWLQQAYDQNR